MNSNAYEKEKQIAAAKEDIRQQRKRLQDEFNAEMEKLNVYELWLLGSDRT